MTVTPAIEDMELARQALSKQEMALFLNQQTSEQVHSLKVFIQMREHGEQSPELLSAALLHDVGKSRYTLRIWERAVVVIGRLLRLVILNRGAGLHHAAGNAPLRSQDNMLNGAPGWQKQLTLHHSPLSLSGATTTH